MSINEVLNQAGKATETLECENGSKIVILPHGARVIGLFSPTSDQNFLWTNPTLNEVKEAQEFFSGDQWLNSGGDRTWLAPEVDLFFPDYPSLQTYVQPRQFDPGSFKSLRTKDEVVLQARFDVLLSRTKETLSLGLIKVIKPTPNPLRYEADLDLEGVEYVGYAQTTGLEIQSGKGQVGIWNLLQLPHGGDLIVPTYHKAQPVVYFGDIPAGEIQVSDQHVHYRMVQKGEHKIGIRAVDTTGRAGYLFKQGEKWSLVVRSFSVNPSGEYIDCPWKDQQNLGFAFQACNVNGDLGQFSELEYHAPAVGQGTGRNKGVDESQVWAFRGSYETITKISQRLISGMN